LRERRGGFAAKYFLLLCKLCAMLLKLFFTVDTKILRKKQDERGEKEIFSRSVSRVTQGFAAGLVPAVESPAAVGRALCLLL